MNFFYVYILQSEKGPETFYVGFTEDLRSRLPVHNSGSVPHTSKSLPWRIRTAVAFKDRKRALEFERYLKSASGARLRRRDCKQPSVSAALRATARAGQGRHGVRVSPQSTPIDD